MHLETIALGLPVVLGSGLLACLAIAEVGKVVGQHNGVAGEQPHRLATEEEMAFDVSPLKLRTTEIQ